MKVREDFSYASRDTLPGYRSAWVTKYCTMKEVDDFTLYFPFIILMFSLLMVVVERGFNRYYYQKRIHKVRMDMIDTRVC